MNFAPRYLGRGSWLARRDPRVLVLVVVLFIFTVLQVWDAACGPRCCCSSRASTTARPRIPLRGGPPQLGRSSSCSSASSSSSTRSSPAATSRHPADESARLLLRCRCSARRSPPSRSPTRSTQLMRFLAMTTVGFPLAFAIAPADFGVAFAPARRARQVRLRHRPDLPLPAVAAARPADDRRRPAHPRPTTGGRQGRSGPGKLRGIGPASWCRRSSTRSPAPRTPSTRWTCAGSGPATDLARHLAYDGTDKLVIGFFWRCSVVITSLPGSRRSRRRCGRRRS